VTIRRFVLLLAVFLVALPAAAQGRLGFEGLERSLRLSPYQKQQFDVAVTATQRAMVAIGLGALQAKSRLVQELLKDRPDPNALLMAQEELVEFSKPHVNAAREEWIRFYAMLDEDQVRIARSFVEEKLRLLERLGEHLGRHVEEALPIW
jgi:hypothetical protein